MTLSVKGFTEKEARALCRWRYPRPYDGYNCPDWETVQAEHWGMADEARRRQEFYAVYGGEAYVGFFRLVKREDCVMLGLGLRPDLCGKGMGPDLMKLILAAADTRYGRMRVRLEVRAFNQRAIQCYKRAGFREVDRVTGSTPSGPGEFVWMERMENGSLSGGDASPEEGLIP